MTQERKTENKQDLRDSKTLTVDLVKALDSDMKIYSHLIKEGEKSIGIKSNRKHSYYIFDAEKNTWLEESDMKNFNADNFLVFKFLDDKKEIANEELTKIEQPNQNIKTDAFSKLLEKEIIPENNEKLGNINFN